MKYLSNYFELTRPFTLIYPFVGVIASAVCALGMFQNFNSKNLFTNIILCAIAASILNAGSNILNQIADINIDKINKPNRPISSGRINIEDAKIFAVILYSISIFVFVIVSYYGNIQCLWIGLTVVFITYIYSYGPRTKSHWIYSNLTIGLARGPLLVLMGWASVQQVTTLDPIFIGSIWALFLFGAACSKDFSDIEGDEKHNCLTWPIRFGVKKAAVLMTPFLTLPFLLFIIYNYLGWLDGNALILNGLGIILTLWGGYISFLILKNPMAMTNIENHPSWIHMYLLLMVGQVGLSVAYW